jgi:putative colanic acid biosynthesis UDP-glucose lipid carrier transferase
MSLVGPRPHPISLDNEFESKIENYMNRYYVKPGITGLAQITGFRGETDTIEKMQGRVDADLKYIEKQSIYIDITILLKTFKVLFSGV